MQKIIEITPPFDIQNQDVQVLISPDGKTLWVNTIEGCVLRCNNCKRVEVEDGRKIRG